jgi:hypothetical protein
MLSKRLRTCRVAASILLVALGFGFILLAVGQAEGTRVLVLPASGVVAPGETVTMEIEVRDVENLFGVDIGLAFDADKLEAQDVTVGEFLDPVFEAQKTVDNRAGRVHYVFALMGPVESVSGSGVVARVVFRGLAEGDSAVYLEQLLLANDAAEEIPATASGAVVVVGSGAATATASSTATVTPSGTLVSTRSPTATSSPTARATVTVTATPTQVASPTPVLEEMVLQQAGAALGWSATVDSQPPVYKITHVAAAGHLAEARIQRSEYLGEAEDALQQERLGLAAAGWDVHTLHFNGCEAYRASRSVQPDLPMLPAQERRFGFGTLFWVVSAYAFDESSQAPAPDPPTVAQAVYEAGLECGLFGPRYPWVFLPLVMRAYAAWPAGPTATALASPTTTLSPSATGTLTLTPTATASPTVTEGPPSSPTASPTTTVNVTPSPTTLFEQVIANPSFESDGEWTLQGGLAPGYSVSRAHKGLRSMRLGIVAPYSGGVWSSVRQQVIIPQDASEAQLSFFYFPVSSPVDSDYMYFILRRVPDGEELARVVWMEREQVWNLWTYDLSIYAGQAVQLWIGVYNDGQGITTVHLDDVELWAATDE